MLVSLAEKFIHNIKVIIKIKNLSYTYVGPVNPIQTVLKKIMFSQLPTYPELVFLVRLMK